MRYLHKLRVVALCACIVCGYTQQATAREHKTLAFMSKVCPTENVSKSDPGGVARVFGGAEAAFLIPIIIEPFLDVVLGRVFDGIKKKMEDYTKSLVKVSDAKAQSYMLTTAQDGEGRVLTGLNPNSVCIVAITGVHKPENFELEIKPDTFKGVTRELPKKEQFLTFISNVLSNAGIKFKQEGKISSYFEAKLVATPAQDAFRIENRLLFYHYYFGAHKGLRGCKKATQKEQRKDNVQISILVDIQGPKSGSSANPIAAGITDFKDISNTIGCADSLVLLGPDDFAKDYKGSRYLTGWHQMPDPGELARNNVAQLVTQNPAFFDKEFSELAKAFGKDVEVEPANPEVVQKRQVKGVAMLPVTTSVKVIESKDRSGFEKALEAYAEKMAEATKAFTKEQILAVLKERL